jgi:endonuclease YncB( thermonuclease family)
MREKRLRWDEGSGEMRLEETAVTPRASRWRTWAIVAFAAIVVAGGWAWWRSQPVTGTDSTSEEAIEPATESADAQGWAPEGPVLVGRVSAVTDGDTIKVELSSGPVEVRMHSIDAPERDQPGGREARATLERRLQGAEVTLEPVQQDQYGRMIAVVYLDDANLNALLVREGYAWLYREYARDPRYCAAEIAARGERRGIWARPGAEQAAPWEWRAVKRGRRDGYSDYSGETFESCVAALGKRAAKVAPMPLAAVPAASEGAPGKCRIKGNISGSGKIYHVPGTAAYEKTRIDESKGERWFCTEEEARAAGWRAPRG